MQKVTKAVIPAAGLGTRFLPVTKGMPKEMLAIGTHPAIEYIVREASLSGIKDVLIIINKEKTSIKKYFRHGCVYDTLPDQSRLEELDKIIADVNISFAYQKNFNGNGAVILEAEKFAKGEPFAVLFGDDVVHNAKVPATKQLIDAYEKTGTCIIGCQEREPEEAVRYGVIKKGAEDGRLTEVLGIIEKPTIDELPSNLCSLGRFVLTPDIFDVIRRTPMHKGEIYLTVALDIIRQEKGLFAYNFEGIRYDLGNRVGFLKANIEHYLRHADAEEVKEYLKELAAKDYKCTID